MLSMRKFLRRINDLRNFSLSSPENVLCTFVERLTTTFIGMVLWKCEDGGIVRKKSDKDGGQEKTQTSGES